MKKYLLLILCCFLLVGCNDVKGDDVLKKFEEKITNTENYELKGTMDIKNHEELYNYDVEVYYKKGDYYKVKLLNTETSHEQIILKNDDWVYVVTPALNKSFKFQSDWPNNSSQAYILKTVLKDLKNDPNRAYESVNDTYILQSKVNYPNNSNLSEQKITFNKDILPEKIEVLDNNGVTQISLVIQELNLKSKNDKEFFALESNVDENCCDETKTTSELSNILYPMYLPTGTSYTSEEKIKNDNSERLILTYSGEKPFILIEETAGAEEDLEVTAVNGEIVMYGSARRFSRLCWRWYWYLPSNTRLVESEWNDWKYACCAFIDNFRTWPKRTRWCLSIRWRKGLCSTFSSGCFYSFSGKCWRIP